MVETPTVAEVLFVLLTGLLPALALTALAFVPARSDSIDRWVVSQWEGIWLSYPKFMQWDTFWPDNADIGGPLFRFVCVGVLLIVAALFYVRTWFALRYLLGYLLG